MEGNSRWESWGSYLATGGLRRCFCEWLHLKQQKGPPGTGWNNHERPCRGGPASDGPFAKQESLLTV